MEDHTYYLAQEKARERESSPSKRRKHEEAKRKRDRRRQKTRINIGVAFPKWKSLMRDKCLHSDAEVACFLLDSFERGPITPTPMKGKPFQVTAPAVSSIGASSGTDSFRRLYKKNGRRYRVYTLKSEKTFGYISELHARIVKRRITGGVGMPRRRSLRPEDPRGLGLVPPIPAPATSEVRRGLGPVFHAAADLK